MKVVSSYDIGDSPARVNRFTGTIYYNAKLFPNYPESLQKIIIGHEEGHYKLDTRSEFEADEYAFQKYAGTRATTGVSLRDIEKSISDVLQFDKPQHRERQRQQWIRLLEYDWTHNNNKKAYEALQILKQEDMNYATGINGDSGYSMVGFDDEGFDDFLGLGGTKEERAAKKAAKQKAKLEKKAAKTNIKNAKAEAKRAGGGTSWWNKALDTAGNIFGKKDTTAADAGAGAGGGSGEEKKFLGMPQTTGIMVAIVVVIVIAIVIWKYSK